MSKVEDISQNVDWIILVLLILLFPSEWHKWVSIYLYCQINLPNFSNYDSSCLIKYEAVLSYYIHAHSHWQVWLGEEEEE